MFFLDKKQLIQMKNRLYKSRQILTNLKRSTNNKIKRGVFENNLFFFKKPPSKTGQAYPKLNFQKG